MWRAILTSTRIDTKREPGKTLLIIVDKEGPPNLDPDAAWREAQEFLEEARSTNPNDTVLDICIRPASYKVEENEPRERIRRLN